MVQEEFGGLNEVKKIERIESENKIKIMVNGKVYMCWGKGDDVAERLAITQLYECGAATQEELANIFDKHVNSIAKYINAFQESGCGFLADQPRGPKEKWKVTAEARGMILYLVFKEGVTEYEAIRKRLSEWKIEIGVSSIREVLIENGLVKESIAPGVPCLKQPELFEQRTSPQMELKFGQAAAEVPKEKYQKENKADSASLGTGNNCKSRDRYSQSRRIYIDRLEQGMQNSYGGGLLYIPLLRRYNFLPMIKRVINFSGEEGYSLEELCLTLFFYDVFGFKSIENFKTVYPEEFGILIGKTKSPGIKTMRRFMHKIRALEKGEVLIEEFAKGYLREGTVKWGVLYIDEHFLPYYGIRLITMGWFTVRDKALKGSYNFLANDEEYNPLLFLIRPSSEDLLEKIPEIILKAKRLAVDAGIDPKDLTVIFDREGYSAKLFRMLSDKETPTDSLGKEAVKFISWAKYSDKWVDDLEEDKFTGEATIKYAVQKSETVRYYDGKREMNKYGELRAIVIESGQDKHRAAIYTNDEESSASRIIQLISLRWGQENLIKALKLKHLIDYHPGYVSEELEEQPLTKNPELSELKKQKAILSGRLHGKEQHLGRIILKEKNSGMKLEDLEKREIDLMAEIRSLESQITLMEQKASELPGEVRYDQAHNGEKLSELDYEKKRFLDCIKVFAYHLEKQMCELLDRYYSAGNMKKEIAPALAMIVNRGAFLRLEEGKLKVKLRRFQNPEIDYAARRLCEDLNGMCPEMPDKTRLPLYFEVV